MILSKRVLLIWIIALPINARPRMQSTGPSASNLEIVINGPFQAWQPVLLPISDCASSIREYQVSNNICWQISSPSYKITRDITRRSLFCFEMISRRSSGGFCYAVTYMWHRSSMNTLPASVATIFYHWLYVPDVIGRDCLDGKPNRVWNCPSTSLEGA